MCSVAGGAGGVRPELVEAMIRVTAHRGPDGRACRAFPTGRPPLVVLGHARLAIVDPAGGAQPIGDERGRTRAITNGEIYNHLELRAELARRGHRFASASDAEVLVHLMEESLRGLDAPLRGHLLRASPLQAARAAAAAFARLDGMLAAAVWQAAPGGGGWLVLGRDALGIRPLYWGSDASAVYFASEIKAIRLACADYREFPPGHVAVWALGPRGELSPPAFLAFGRWPWVAGGAGPGPDEKGVAGSIEEGASPDELQAAADQLGALVTGAVVKRLMADAPVGVLLSGGVDSAVVAALARRHYPGVLHSFAVGTRDGPDLEASLQAAQAIGTVHHLRPFGEREARRLLPAVVYHLESFDAPLVRSALANHLVFETASDYVKVALTGEGSDELFGGYASLAGLSGADLAEELVRLLATLHRTNLQRADRMGLAHGVEARVPFLDLAVVAWAMALPPHLKRRRSAAGAEQDKLVLRTLAARWLPPELAWRPKAKFSQGSGAAALLGELARELLTEREWRRLQARYPDLPLASREQALYFRIFLDFFPEEAARRTVGLTRSVVPGEVA